MMDIEKLIERLGENTDCWTDKVHGYADLRLEAATALSTLQEENEKLRNEVERQRRSADDRKHLYENAERAYMKVLAELERVTAERDAAIDCCSGYCATCRFVKDCAKHDMNDAAPIRWYYGDCEDWEWRGQKED